MPNQPEGRYTQPSFADLGTPLSEVTFMVVDLETTGVASDSCAITEVGAVKVRGGEVEAEFSILVNPRESIDARISKLTGINDSMVAEAPTIEQVLPAFLEFAAGTVWVAHNASFDVGFLRAACRQCGYAWPRPQVVDTVLLARRLVDRGEVANRRLATLARYFGARVTPTHRALDDARATVDVMHALLERLGAHYVLTDTDLADFQRAIPATERGKKRHLAEGLPHSPGVYIFRDARRDPLYVGTSVNIAARVRGYFSAGENRARMRDMLRAAESVDAIECAHRLEAGVRELRLIGATKPPFNRASKHPEKLLWLRLTAEPYPRLSIARKPPPESAAWLGPFTSRRTAQAAMDAVHTVLPLRQCHSRLSARVATSACALAEMGCPAPCQLHITVEDYAKIAAEFAAAVTHDPSQIVNSLRDRLAGLAATQRFEEAAETRTRLTAFLRGVTRMQRAHAISRIEEMVVARPAAGGGWEFAVVRRGLLAAAGTSPPRVDPMPTVDSLLEEGAAPPADDSSKALAHLSETELIANWMESDGIRLVRADSGWSLPVNAAARYTRLLERLRSADETRRVDAWSRS